MTQKINPYKKATEPPEGITMPIEPPKQIHVLMNHVSVCSEDYYLLGRLVYSCWNLLSLPQRALARLLKGINEATHFKMANVIATIVNLDSRGLRCPSEEG